MFVHFTIEFCYCFRVFSLLIAFVLFITVSSGVYVSQLALLLFYKCRQLLFFTVTVVFCVVILRMVWILESYFLPYTPSQHLTQPIFIRTFLGPVVVPSKLRGLLRSFETQTRLFESQKRISR